MKMNEPRKRLESLDKMFAASFLVSPSAIVV